MAGTVESVGATRYLVCGSGPVSLAFALFAVRRGVPPAAIAFERAPAPVPTALASRALAIAHGGRQLLERVARFPACGTIDRVEVSIAGRAGRTRIAASDLDAPALGHVVRYGALLDALRQAADGIRWGPAEGDATAADVRVHAEGDPGDDADVRKFGQCALLAEVVTTAAPPASATTAFERFTGSGPLALLPLPEPRRRALVWCDTAERCHGRAQADRGERAAELAARFGRALGPLVFDGPLGVAPLARRARRRLDAPGESWIGNAAQTLHPVAGQGLNLGLRDAFELAGVLAEARRRGESARVALSKHRRARRHDRAVTIALTDLMAEAFTWPLAAPVQSRLLALLDVAPPLRRPLASQLMFGWR